MATNTKRSGTRTSMLDPWQAPHLYHLFNQTSSSLSLPHTLWMCLTFFSAHTLCQLLLMAGKALREVQPFHPCCSLLFILLCTHILTSYHSAPPGKAMIQEGCVCTQLCFGDWAPVCRSKRIRVTMVTKLKIIATTVSEESSLQRPGNFCKNMHTNTDNAAFHSTVMSENVWLLEGRLRQSYIIV